MSKSIELTVTQWGRLLRQLKQDQLYPPSVMLIRSKMVKTLGFSFRRHCQTIQVQWKHGLRDRQRITIMLDFYSEKKYTWFILKYGEYVGE